jgi:hypothetical protein
VHHFSLSGFTRTCLYPLHTHTCTHIQIHVHIHTHTHTQRQTIFVTHTRTYTHCQQHTHVILVSSLFFFSFFFSSPSLPFVFECKEQVFAQYLRIEVAGSQCLNLAEVQVFSSSGEILTDLTASMDSTHSSQTPDGASRCLDGDESTVCHNACSAGGWLEIDLGMLPLCPAVLNLSPCII